MATLKQLIEKASQLPKQEYGLWDENLLSAVGLDTYYHNYDDPVNLTINHLKQWYCTDTWVGINVIYLNNSPVAITNQTARKSDVGIYFLSEADKNLVKDYLLSLYSGQQDYSEYLTEDDLNEDMGDYFKIEYASEVLYKTAWLNGEQVEITQKPRNLNDNINFHTVAIKHKDGVEEWVDVRELDFEYCSAEINK